MLSADDKLAIHALISLYGHIIDDREFSRVHELFTEDAVYDVSDFNAGVYTGRLAHRAPRGDPARTGPDSAAHLSPASAAGRW